MCAHSQRQAGKQQQSIHLPLKKPKRYKFCPEINLPLFLSLSFATSLLQPLTPSRVYLFIFFSEGHYRQKKKKGRVGFDGMQALLRRSRCSSVWLPGGLQFQHCISSRTPFVDCPAALGQMPSSQSPMTNPSSHLSLFVSEEKEGQAEHGKASPGSQLQASSLRPNLFNTPARCLLLGYDVTNRTGRTQRVQQVMSKLSSSGKGKLASFTNSARQGAAQ